jgi:rRNA maturation RNase YbeY
VNILIKHPKNWGLIEEMVLEAAKKALKSFGYGEETELSIYFVGKAKAKKLNLEYRKKSYIPQVLGFPMDKDKDIDGVVRLGDVVICTQKLKYEVEFQKKTLAVILDEWMRHGVENLLK